ncbi:MAG: 3'(2'),5'-bisphosphate nucleotidase CysQ [Candidatus Scalinduaceae bacterium]
MDNIQYTQLILTALFAAKRAGEAILEVYNSDFAVERKDDNSPLTLADKRSHEIIMDDLRKPIEIKNSKHTYNNLTLPILSEEGRDIPFDERKGWEYFWLVDPLDGTKEFIKRNGEFTVNIALIHKNNPVLGVIYVPVKDTFYFAAMDIGAYKLVNSKIVNDKLLIKELLGQSKKLSISANDKKASLTIIGSRSHATKEFSEFIEYMKEKHGEVELISAGSSLKFCLVAEGTADVYPRFGPTMEWDTAAGQAIVEQVEGRVVDIHTKEPLRYNKRNLLNPFFIIIGQNPGIVKVLP